MSMVPSSPAVARRETSLYRILKSRARAPHLSDSGCGLRRKDRCAALRLPPMSPAERRTQMGGRKHMPQAGKPVGLLVTCLVDLMRPAVGFAAVKLLEDAGCTVE